MADVTAAMVKELRDKTGAGMMDCKAALNATGGDMSDAVDWLRTKGLAKAAKKSARVAAEGLVALVVDDNLSRGAVVEVNSETDFVARNGEFQTLVADVARLAVDVGGELEALKSATVPNTTRTVDEHITDLVSRIGENLSLRRAAYLAVDRGVIGAYVHNQVAPNMGKIGVLVALRSAADPGKLQDAGKQLAMHVAAAQPLAVTEKELDPALVARERAVFTEQSRASGKPDNVVEKMVEGRLRKYYEDVVLLAQTFVIDGETRVAQILERLGKEVSAPVEVTGFVRFELGAGIEKKSGDFAAEVAAAART